MEGDTTLKRKRTLKQKVNKTVNKGWRSVTTGLGKVLETKIVNIFVVSVLVIDVMIIMANLIVKLYEVNHPNLDSTDQVLTYITMGLRSFYLLMIVVRVCSYGLIYLADPLNLFDAIIVIVAAILFMVFSGRDQIISSLFIVCRLWRINRIVEANTQKSQEKHDIKYNELQEQLSAQLDKERENNTRLRKKLEENDRSLSLLMGEDVFEADASLKREKNKFHNYSYLSDFDSILKV